MLGVPEIATIRAALLYWQEEICPHGAAAGKQYLEETSCQPLSVDEIDRLRAYLTGGVRYAILDPAEDRLLDARVWASPEEALTEAGGHLVVTVLIPPPAPTTPS